MHTHTFEGALTFLIATLESNYSNSVDDQWRGIICENFVLVFISLPILT